MTEKEIAAAVEFWRSQGTAQYQEKFLEAPREENESRRCRWQWRSRPDNYNDELFQDAVRIVLEYGKASTSLLHTCSTATAALLTSSI